MGDTQVFFGKHRGKMVRELPDGYLDWLSEQNWVREPLRTAVRQEMQERGFGEPDQDSLSREYRAICGEEPVNYVRAVVAGRNAPRPAYRAAKEAWNIEYNGTVRKIHGGPKHEPLPPWPDGFGTSTNPECPF